MPLPPPPTWLVRGPCDLKGLDRTPAEAAWIAAALGQSSDARAAAEAVVASAALIFNMSGVPPHVSRRAVAALETVLDAHPNAAYVLATALQLGTLGLQPDAVRAQMLFERGWTTHANIGCVVGLFVAADSPAARRVQSDRLVRFALLPDCLARARATGSLSTMSDVLWDAAESLKEDPAPCLTGAAPADEERASALRRLYEMAAELDDPHAMLELAKCELGRFASPSGYVLPLRPSAKGEALCVAIAAHASGPPNIKSEALGLLGSAAKQRGDLALARGRFDEALRVCEEAGGKWLGGVD